MPEAHPPRIALAALLLASCGGSAPEPAAGPGIFAPERPGAQPEGGPRPATASSSGPAPSTAATLAARDLGEPATPCALSGKALFPQNTLIQSAAGKPIARFSGAEANVNVLAITLAGSARAYLETGTGRGNFNVRGFVEARKLPAFTAQPVPVFAGHLTIGESRAVSIVGATADGKIKVEKQALTPLQQSFTTYTTCSALTLTPSEPPSWSPAGNARGYVAKKTILELFDAPQGSSVGALYKAPDAPGLLFFSTEQAGGWVRVERHGDIIATGWARATDLSALPRGETMDQLTAPRSVRGPARLLVPGSPELVRATKAVPVRAVASDSAAPIALVEPDAEVYVLDDVADWASVMPRALDIVPTEGGQFWVKKRDLYP